jgi:hypothetical protein
MQSMQTNLLRYFSEIDEIYQEYFGIAENVKFDFQTEKHNWINNFYKSSVFRHVHLEHYKTDRIGVLHSNIFPVESIDFPILGIDLIEMGGKITGFFFDITPIITENEDLKNLLLSFNTTIKSKKRNLPEWANFFSNDFICVSPDENEIEALIIISKIIIREYLNYSKNLINNTLKIKEIQNNYCIGQKKNDKTFKALSAEIGEENAKHFLNNYLFPEI